MKRLGKTGGANILHLLCEGMSIRAIARTTGASKTTITKLVVDAGMAAARYQAAQSYLQANSGRRDLEFRLRQAKERCDSQSGSRGRGRRVDTVAAGVTMRLWEIDDIVDVLETWDSAVITG